MPRHVEGDHAEIRRDARIVEQAAVLARVRSGGVQAHERNPFACLLDIEAMRAAEQIEVQIAADDRLELRARRAGGGRCLSHRRGLARGGEHVLEIEEVRHQRMQVALDAQEATLEQRKDVVQSRHRHRLPERLPRLARRPQREAVVRRHERPTGDADDASIDDADEPAGVADLEQKRGVDEAPALDQARIGIHQLGQTFDHRGCSPAHINFTRASTATTPSVFTISGLISASAMAGSSMSASCDRETIARARASRSPAGLPR